jgi:hypothetical protein
VFHVPAGRFMAVGRNVTTGFFALPIICLAPDCNSRTDPANTKPGREMAMVWAIMPPSEVPTMWARSQPSASSTATASPTMSSSR